MEIRDIDFIITTLAEMDITANDVQDICGVLRKNIKSNNDMNGLRLYTEILRRAEKHTEAQWLEVLNRDQGENHDDSRKGFTLTVNSKK